MYHRTKPAPIIAYHFKFLLFVNMFIDDKSSSLTTEVLIFRSSKPCPIKPITNNATAVKDNIGSMFFNLISWNISMSEILVFEITHFD